jgi:hypothetical protein
VITTPNPIIKTPVKSKKYPRLEKIGKEFLIVVNFVDVDDFVVF